MITSIIVSAVLGYWAGSIAATNGGWYWLVVPLVICVAGTFGWYAGAYLP